VPATLTTELTVATERTFGAGFFIIDLDGERVGDVSAIAGGGYTAEVSRTTFGATGYEQTSVASRSASLVEPTRCSGSR
jgi:hypothetical protein